MSGGRIRTIKPEILEDEKAAALSPIEWRLWVSLWTLADDYGNLRGAPDWLHGQVFWARPEVSPDDTREALARLSRDSLVTLYTVSGQSYVSVVNWSRHQRVDRPGKPRVPGPKNADSFEENENSRKSLESGAGVERESRARAGAGAVPLPLPDPGPIPDPGPDPDRARVLDSDRETACPMDLDVEFTGYREISERIGVPEDALRRGAHEFVSYWTVGGGSGKRKSHWAKWLRKDLMRKNELGKFAEKPVNGGGLAAVLAAIKVED